jgi:acetyl-CoA synthetase
LLTPCDNYGALIENFSWQVPTVFNMGADVCDRHADGTGRPALMFVDEDQRCCGYTFDDLRRLSNRFANVLVRAGLRRGDRVCVLLPQRPETAVAHIAAFKAGLISVPLFTLFGEQALEFRLANSAAKALVTDAISLDKINSIIHRLPSLDRIYVVGRDATAGSAGDHVAMFEAAIELASDAFEPVPTGADEPALLIYTSGTTGNPKGALHAHRVLLGHLPGVELSHDFLPQPGDFCWTPADWAWIGGLLDVPLPAWYHGVPVLAHPISKFDPEFALRLMAEHGVRNAFLPPTALKLMRQAKARQPGMQLRTVASGGESLGEELLGWGQETFGLTINEFYGQTECNMVVSNNARLFPVQPGSMGRAAPGHKVRIVDEAGTELPIASPKIPYGGFSPVRLRGRTFRRGLPHRGLAIALRALYCHQ